MADTFRKEYTPLTDDQKARMTEIKTKAEELEKLFNEAMWAGHDMRQLKIAHTNLEQSIMWAVKAVTGKALPMKKEMKS